MSEGDPSDVSPEAAIKELAVLVRRNVVNQEQRHKMIDLLTGISSHLYILRADLEEAEDGLEELQESIGKEDAH